MMNALLVSSSILDNLWGETILSACHYKKNNKTPYELWKDYASILNYLKVWGCLAKVMLLEPKKRKISSKTGDCMLFGYVKHSITHRFLVLTSDVFECNTIIETKKKSTKFFKYIYPLNEKVSHATRTLNAPLDDVDKSNMVSRRSKKNKENKLLLEMIFIHIILVLILYHILK